MSINLAIHRMKTVARSDVGYYAGESLTFTGVQTSQCHNYDYDPFVVQHTGHFFETLHEEYTPNSSGSRKDWKNFEHYKAFRSSNPPASSTPVHNSGFAPFNPSQYCNYVAFGKGGRFGVVGYDGNNQNVRPLGEPGLPIEGLPAYRVYRPDGGFIPAPDLLESLKGMSAKVMLPSIKAELLSLNSIIELKDFKSLPRTIDNMFAFKDRFLRGIGNLGDTLRHLLHASGDGYLQAKFNLLPLLSDIAGIQHAILNTKRAIDNLLIRSRTVQYRHFAYNWNEFADELDGYSPVYLATPPASLPAGSTFFSGCYLSRSTTNLPSRFHAEIEYNYTLSRYEIENAQLLGFLDAFGVNANAAIIWNAIPWSFVVDWVLGVSRWLTDHATLNLEPKVIIRRYGWSVVRERNISTRKTTLGINGYPQTSGRTVTLPTVKETAYRRSLDSLNLASLTTSGLSPTEIALGAALTIPRRWRPRQRH